MNIAHLIDTKRPVPGKAKVDKAVGAAKNIKATTDELREARKPKVPAIDKARAGQPGYHLSSKTAGYSPAQAAAERPTFTTPAGLENSIQMLEDADLQTPQLQRNVAERMQSNDAIEPQTNGSAPAPKSPLMPAWGEPARVKATQVLHPDVPTPSKSLSD